MCCVNKGLGVFGHDRCPECRVNAKFAIQPRCGRCQQLRELGFRARGDGEQLLVITTTWLYA